MPAYIFFLRKRSFTALRPNPLHILHYSLRQISKPGSWQFNVLIHPFDLQGDLPGEKEMLWAEIIFATAWDLVNVAES